MTRPEYGVRLCFEEPKVIGIHVQYRLVVYLPEDEFSARLKIHTNTGAVQEQAWESAAPPSSAAQLVGPIARTIWTSWKKDPKAGWPRRVMRWRALKV